MPRFKQSDALEVTGVQEPVRQLSQLISFNDLFSTASKVGKPAVSLFTDCNSVGYGSGTNKGGTAGWEGLPYRDRNGIDFITSELGARRRRPILFCRVLTLSCQVDYSSRDAADDVVV